MFDANFRRIATVATLLAAFAAAAPALAQERGANERGFERGVGDRLTQLFGRQSPPADIDDDPPPPRVDSGASVRIDRLENQLRAMTGQIEQLQFTVRKLEDQLRRQQTGDAGQPPAAPVAPAATASIDPPRTPLRRGDAFDPATQPNAPGAPRQIGMTAPSVIPSTPVAASTRLPGGPIGEAGAPMDISGGRVAANGAVTESPRGAIVGTPLPAASAPPAPQPLAPQQAALPVTPGGTVIASHEPFSPKEEFDLANGYLKGGQYDAAEKGYAAFLAKNPKSRLAPEAVFNLGETFFQRGRHREAAEQYLKISTTYSNSSRAPEAMLRLGQSLNALGAKEQACASFSEVARKYPNATPTVRAAAERETKKSAC